MKWINGLTSDAKWKIKKNRLENWHKWFAWYPVTIEITEDGHKVKVWWEKLWRIGTFHPGCDYGYWTWEYKERKDRGGNDY
jgi:hypothetical protein